MTSSEAMPDAATSDAATADEGPDRSAAVEVRNVSKVFADGTHALDDVSLTVAPGEFVALIGPSGCGKSTLLRAIAGLTSTTAGTCEMASSVRRAFVFQQPTLLPWRTSIRNAELLLMLEGVGKQERRERALAAMKLVGLEGFERSFPRALSGGMKMRLSLARALALNPNLFLLDEPFSAVDEITRESLNDELVRIWVQERFTSILVTHNLYEAVFLAQRVVVMSPRPGRISSIIEVPFEYPRPPELRGDPEYARIVGELSQQLREVSR